MSAPDELPEAARVASQPAAPPPVPDVPEIIFELMHTMRAMRRLKPDPVPRDLLEQLVAAATWAPSASNGQAYSYLIITDRAQMSRLAVLWRKVADFYLPLAENFSAPILTAEQSRRVLAAVRYQEEHFAQTPALIVACYNTSSPRLSDLPDLWRSLRGLGWRHGWMVARHLGRCKLLGEAASSYPGVQNLLLAARALGLGATLTVWHLFLEDDFKSVLDIPRHVTPFALIPVGYPLGHFGPVNRIPAAEVIHWDRW
jgi:nitroreductase